jgi:nicotinate-nucleotide pyrophosphorylase (carboxylating)
MAGLEEAARVFEHLGARLEPKARDGSWVAKGKEVAAVEGSAHAVLMGERLALNIIQRMSGIATLTRQAVDAARAANPHVVVAATRKTTPGFRAYEKRAVELGGGDPHRQGLDDMVLVKDNHIKLAGGVREAMERLERRRAQGPRNRFALKVEVEVSTARDALQACALGADIVMMDNMGPDALRRAYRAVKRAHPHVLVEVSGNITARNISRVAPYADIVSMGSLTHSAPARDFHLKVEPID